MRRRVHPVGIALVVTLTVLATTVPGLDAGLLLCSPLLVLLVPLLAGRYLGEEQLARLAARYAPRRRRPVAALRPTRRRMPLSVCGGRLIAASLAERGPPLRLVIA